MPGTPIAAGSDETSQLQIRFVVPPAFHDLPVFGTEDQVAAELWELACKVLAADPAEVRLGWAALLAELIPPMGAAGVIYAGVCLAEVDGRPSSAAITASVCPLVGTDLPGAVDFLLARLARARPGAEVTAIDLPAGRAVAVIDALPANAPLDDGRELTVSLIQVHLPLPNETELLTLELSTPCPEEWELYSELFAGVVRNLYLEFADLPYAAGPVEPPDEELAARVRAAFG
ncbi:hypothetical protein VM98_00150 [Streptomyces rubellomurinus subsp. indigoferus]|nr:hypothetical protein VM98_00150 [Streptomyces rubellomurinus subsp. indigoferus]